MKWAQNFNRNKSKMLLHTNVNISMLVRGGFALSPKTNAANHIITLIKINKVAAIGKHQIHQ